MPLRLYNSLTKQIEDFRPADPGSVSFYTCGPTVYDDAHIGNFRSFLAADLLRRFIESPLCALANETPAQRTSREQRGRRVTHVMNITDVGHMTDDAEGGESGEDRMAVAGRRLEEAKKSGALPPGVSIDPRDPYQIAKFYESRFREDARALGLKISLEAEQDASLHPKATAHVPGMIRLIERLITNGNAYVVGQPGSRVVYFDVRTFPAYGRLSGNTVEALREGEGGRVLASNQAGKRSPADFLLWKEDASHIMKWESPWGSGYPGWHIECSVMSLRARGGGDEATLTLPDGAPIIDLHSGGEDNIFPHHECELAQSCCAFNASPAGAPFASMWFHPRFLLVEGTKMSKSKGNFYTARDLFAKGVEPAAIRLELIKTHYRTQANFTMQGLTDSQRTTDRWRRFLAAARGGPDAAHLATDACRASFSAAMHSDLNIAEAIASINVWVAAIEAPGPREAALFDVLDGVIGVLGLRVPEPQQSDLGVYAPGVTPDPEVEGLLRKRRDARAARDFKASDAIRDQLASMGLVIKDMPGGKVEVRRASPGKA